MTSILIEGRLLLLHASLYGAIRRHVCDISLLCHVDLDKYTAYKLRVAASTAVGESSLSEEDDIFVFTLEDGMC